jgi:predicted NBD/HSP70 family sugar kinase
LRNRPTVIEAAIRDAENDIIARVSERLESQPELLTPASAAAIARELMHL